MRSPRTAPSVAITWLRQAGFLARAGSSAVVFDPFLTDDAGMLVAPACTPEQLGDVTAVLVSHEHGDHMDLPTIRRIAAASPRATFVVPEPLQKRLAEADVDPHRVLGARPDVPIKVDGIEIVPVPARHGIHVDDAYTFGTEHSDGLHRFLGYVVRIHGIAIYHAGDTIMYDGMVDRLKRLVIDVALLPINGRDYFREQADIVGNLSAREAADLAAAIGARLVVPMHYDTVSGNAENVGTFVDYLRRTHPEVSTLAPGRHQTFAYTAVRS